MKQEAQILRIILVCISDRSLKHAWLENTLTSPGKIKGAEFIYELLSPTEETEFMVFFFFFLVGEPHLLV